VPYLYIVGGRRGLWHLHVVAPGTHGRSCQAGWTKLLRRVGVVAADARDRAAVGKACRLVGVLILGLYPLVQIFRVLMGIPYTSNALIESACLRTEGLMGITTKIVAEIVLGFLGHCGRC